MVIDERKALLMVKILHHLAARFKEHAILKGGMELALFSSGRSTNDLDFVFVPYESKKNIANEIYRELSDLPGGSYKISLSHNSRHSKFEVSEGEVVVEIEVSVAPHMDSVAVNTAVLAKPHGIQPQIIRVMKPEIALAHKIAAWNERRILRDLYDIYYWYGVLKVSPEVAILKARLHNVESRIPSLRKRKVMSMKQLCEDLEEYLSNFTQDDINRELTSIDVNDRAGLEVVLKSQIRRLIANLVTSDC
jgi:predicted nucleotidyltransferase component of viral defense system